MYGVITEIRVEIAWRVKSRQIYQQGTQPTGRHVPDKQTHRNTFRNATDQQVETQVEIQTDRKTDRHIGILKIIFGIYTRC